METSAVMTENAKSDMELAPIEVERSTSLAVPRQRNWTWALNLLSAEEHELI